MFFLYWHKHHVLLCLHVIKEGKATHPICQDLYGPRPIPLRSFLSYTPPVSIKSCFPSFFVKFVSLRWAEERPLPSRNAFLFIFSSTKKASTMIGTGFQAGDPREIRTPDTLIRSQVLYPAELLGHVAGAEGLKPPTYGFGDRCSINCAMPLSV